MSTRIVALISLAILSMLAAVYEVFFEIPRSVSRSNQTLENFLNHSKVEKVETEKLAGGFRAIFSEYIQACYRVALSYFLVSVILLFLAIS